MRLKYVTITVCNYYASIRYDKIVLSFQPCTEQFFLTLFNQFRDDMTLEMAKYIKSTQGHVLNDESDLKSILAKDAIYNAAGLVSFNLYDEVNICGIFSNHSLLNSINFIM